VIPTIRPLPDERNQPVGHDRRYCSMNAPERPAFTGWHRPSARQPWRPVVQAESQEEAWAMLLTATASGDVTVTASHRDANEWLDKRQRHWNSA